MEPLLNVKNLKASLRANGHLVKIVDGVNLIINKGETVGLVGETGAGKTVSALAILGILQPIGEAKPLWTIEGEVLFKGRDLMKLSEEEMREIRGNEIALVTQNPIASLHPLDMIGHQTGETLEEYQLAEIERIKKLVVEHLGKVEISDAKKRAHGFRHQFSGGEGQRILLAMALIRNPLLLLADEPTSALDVTVQRQILELLKAMKKQFKLSMLLITHNLGVIAEMSDYVYVMYAGKILEHSDVKTIFKNPLHPFTSGLLATVPRIDRDYFKFEGIPGEPPNPLYPISGCKFHPRCKYAKPICSQEVPELVEVEPKHFVADEPVSMLDASIRSEVLKLLLQMQKKLHTSFLYITHDIALARHMCDRIAVMYLGKIVEQGPTEDVVHKPMHPYTEALIAAVPVPDPTARRIRVTIKGEVPSAINPPPGCRFNTRCLHAMEICRSKEPPLIEVADKRFVACHLHTTK